MMLSALCSCATHPEQVPVIQAAVLPPLRIESLKPQNVSLTVSCTRAINQHACNSEQIEALLKSVMMDSLDRGGIKVLPHSKNEMLLTVEDCTNVDPNDECVSLMLTLKTPRYEVESGGRSQNGYRRDNGSSVGGFGDVTKAYQEDLQMAIMGLPQQVKKVLSF